MSASVSTAPPTYQPTAGAKAPAAAPPAAPAVPAPTMLDLETTWDLVERHNQRRRRKGLPELAHDARLFAISWAFAHELARTGVLTHARQSGAPFYAEVDAALGSAVACSENAAEGSDVTGAMAAWDASPDHLANVLGPWKTMSAARAVAADGTPFYVADFAG